MIKPLLKEVARGKRGARDLTLKEALIAAELIVTQQATPAQIGAFMIAERIKMESVEELEAFATVLRKHADRSPIQQGLDCAGPYDGRKKSFYATFATSFVLAAAGLPVTLHATQSLPPKWGVTLLDLVRELDIELAHCSRDTIIRAAEETGVLLIPTEVWCPPLAELRSIRLELGMRTVLNSAEKFIDFSHSPYLAYGVYHSTVFDRMARLISHLGYTKALIIQGVEGSEDLHIDRPTRTLRIENSESTLEVIDPKSFGLHAEAAEVEWTQQQQLLVTQNVLRGEAEPAYRNQVILNAAVRLQLANRVNSIEEGIDTSAALLENGAAQEVFNRWSSLVKS